MKLHLSLILLSALLATASAKEGYYAYVETDAATDAFIPDSTSYSDVTEDVYDDHSYYPAEMTSENSAFRFVGHSQARYFTFKATSFFNAAGSYL